jgi:hypothetical protein
VALPRQKPEYTAVYDRAWRKSLLVSKEHLNFVYLEELNHETE